MKKRYMFPIATVITLGLILITLGAAASFGHSVVGAWYFQAPAPFTPHLATFHDDGTLVVMFPDAAEASRSASTGAGAWKRVANSTYQGRFYEINANRDTNTFQSNLIVTFRITVRGNSFTGIASASYYDLGGNLLEGPFGGPLTGTRIEA
jgi:hypothetical protein